MFVLFAYCHVVSRRTPVAHALQSWRSVYQENSLSSAIQAHVTKSVMIHAVTLLSSLAAIECLHG